MFCLLNLLFFLTFSLSSASLDLKVPNIQKTRRHNGFYVWTEAQSDMIFVAAQKLSDIVWT